MKELTKITIGKNPDFITAVNEDIQLLNQLIKEYNDSIASSVEQKQILINIYEYYQTIINKYPGNPQSPEFKQAFFVQMYQELQNEFKAHGLRSLNIMRISEYEIQAANANSDRTIQEQFEKLLKVEAEGIEFLLKGLTQNYKTKYLDQIKGIPKEDNPEPMYKALKQLRTMVYEDIAKLENATSDKNKLRILIQAINSKLDQLEKKHPEIINRVRVDVKTDSFPDFIANMAPDKVKRMTKILAMTSGNPGTPVNKNDLKSLYSTIEDGGRLYHELLNNHEITFLGSRNSKNFKLTHADGTEWVLKVENRFNAPKEIEVDLATNVLSDTLARVYADRQTDFSPDGYNRSLVLLEYCPGGDLQTHSALQTDTSARIKSAPNIYSQMAAILEAIRKKEAAFPDMKNSNWLIDASGKVRIADSKSFIPATKGLINFKDTRHKWYEAYVNSAEMNPPETRPDSPFNMDKMHAYMLGKNLYQYLTGCDFNYLYGRHNGSYYDFFLPEFQSPEGKELKTLIISLIKPYPNDRISVAKALYTLENLAEKLKKKDVQIADLKRECHALIAEMMIIQGIPVDNDAIENELKNWMKLESPEGLKTQLTDQIQMFKDSCNALKEECVQLVSHADFKDPSYSKRIHEANNFPDLHTLKTELIAKTSENCRQKIEKIAALDLSWSTQKKLGWMDKVQVAQVQQDVNQMKKVNAQLTHCCQTLESTQAHLATDCHHLLDQFSQFELGTTDTLMKEYISSQREKINTTKDINLLNEFTANISMTLKSLQSNEIHKLIMYLRQTQNYFSSDEIEEVVDKIEHAMKQIAVEERDQILFRVEPRFHAVRKALESLEKKGDESLKEEGKKDVEVVKTASTYKNSRHQFFTPLVEKRKDGAVEVDHRPNNSPLK